MSRVKFIVIIVIMILLFGFVIFMNYNQIENFINNKQWELIEPIATIYPEKYLNSSGVGNKILIIENDKISSYQNSNVYEFKVDINFKDVVVNSEKGYCVVGENGGSKLLLFNEKEKLWEFDINGEILEVSVNKNGYVACIYAKSGYKSLVKVITPSGEEMFTNYLASTFALDADISNDNKYLAIAEINTDGINMESDIKIVDMNKTEDGEFRTVNLDGNSLILDVEYSDKNDLFVLEDNKVERINSNYERNTILEYKVNEVSHLTIENTNSAVAVERNDTSIFSSEYVLKIYDGSNEPKQFVLPGSAKSIHIQGRTICVDIGNEVLFLNTNGKLLKRCRVEGQVRDMKIYDNGSKVGIVFKDRIEIVKL